MRRGPNADRTTILSHVRAHLKPDGTGFSDEGINLVLAALASPTIRNRHAALAILEAWVRG
jgi:hypothetical protein